MRARARVLSFFFSLSLSLSLSFLSLFHFLSLPLLVVYICKKMMMSLCCNHSVNWKKHCFFTWRERLSNTPPVTDIVFAHIWYTINFILLLYHKNISKILIRIKWIIYEICIKTMSTNKSIGKPLESEVNLFFSLERKRGLKSERRSQRTLNACVFFSVFFLV